jgi:hypothetical protein
VNKSNRGDSSLFYICRAEAEQWFATKVEELSGMKMTEKAVKQAILSAIR